MLYKRPVEQERTIQAAHRVGVELLPKAAQIEAQNRTAKANGRRGGQNERSVNIK